MFEKYIDKLKDRAKKSKIYREHQLIGLELTQILNDKTHKTFYIKLAKYNNGQELLELAKKSTEKRDIKNPAAYFIKIVAKKGLIKNIPKEKKPRQQIIKF